MGNKGSKKAPEMASEGSDAVSFDDLFAECVSTDDMFAEYEVNFRGRALGSGGYADVFAGVHRPSGEKVAIKLLKRFRFGRPGAEEYAVMKEVAIMKRISMSPNPNLALFRGAYAPVVYGRRRLCIVTELAEGGDLFERIAGAGRFTEKMAAGHFKQFLQGLKALHEMGIVHRDLKPENLLLSSPDDETTRVLITDFGLSEFKHLPMPRHCGTLAYSSPETLERPPRYGEKSDVFAAGIVLFIALSGSPPFYADHTLPKSRHDALLKRQIRSGKFVFYPSLFDSVSQPVKDMIASTLAVDPEERPSIDALLSHPWVGGADVPDVHLAANQESLRKFNAKRKLRVAARLAAWSMTGVSRARELTVLVGSTSFKREQIAHLRERFAKTAGDDGKIDRAEFDRAMGSELEIEDESVLGRMFALFDEDGSGHIEFREFVCGLATLHAGGEDALKMCFDILDVDGSGCLDRDELGVILKVTGSGAGAARPAVSELEMKREAAAAALAAKAAAEGKPADAAVAEPPAVTPSGTAGGAAAGDEETEDSFADRLAYVFEKMDVNKDGRITWDEFRAGLAVEPDLVKAFFKPLDATPGLSSLKSHGSATGFKADGTGLEGAAAGGGGGGADE